MRQQDPRTVWTLLDGDDGDQCLVSGFHFVNRIGYLVSTVPVPDDIDIQVHIPMQAADQEEPVITQRTPQPDELFAAIAKEHLFIPTLDTRRSDRLDFHDVAVWQVEAALIAALDAGRNTASQPPHQRTEGPVRFDAYEIQPCRRYLDMDEPQVSFVEPCEPSEADFWTLYGHIPGEGVQAIGDFDTRQHAEEVFARITGRSYIEPSHNSRRGRP